MTTTNIGPCECCGGAGCPCSETNCLFVWEFVADPINANMWVTIDLCGGGDGSTQPCCTCEEPQTPGDYLGEMRQVPCGPLNSGDKCTCCFCNFVWDEFLGEWLPNQTCKRITTIDDVTYEYNCPGECFCSPPVGSGSFHGEISGPIFCGC